MKGILFKADMLKAIREGRKTVTRRIIKPQPELDASGNYWNFYTKDGGRIRLTFNEKESQGLIKYARYQVGEVVYIKEAIKVTPAYGESNQGSYLQGYMVEYPDNTVKLIFLKDIPKGIDVKPFYQKMFMPAWAARYFIQITDVRPERLQEITEEDAVKEGTPINDFFPVNTAIIAELSTVDYYAELWDSINPKYPFSSNPYVFRYEFQPIPNKG